MSAAFPDDPYEVLGVHRGPTDRELRAAYFATLYSDRVPPNQRIDPLYELAALDAWRGEDDAALEHVSRLLSYTALREPVQAALNADDRFARLRRMTAFEELLRQDPCCSHGDVDYRDGIEIPISPEE